MNYYKYQWECNYYQDYLYHDYIGNIILYKTFIPCNVPYC